MANLVGSKWGSSILGTPGGTVTWSLAGAGLDISAFPGSDGTSVTGDSFLSYDYESVIASAFAQWSAHGDIEFQQVADGGGGAGASATADIRIFFGNIPGPGAGYAYFPGGSGIAGDILMDTLSRFNSDPGLFEAVVLHEIGHSLGLDHQDGVSIMTSSIRYRSLQQDDIDGIQQIYGPQDGITNTPDITLDIGVLDDGSYGNDFNGQTDADGVIEAKFQNAGIDLSLTFKGFDVDFDNEIELLLNGSSLGFLAAGTNGGLSSYSVDISASDQVAGENTITFKQSLDAGWQWGVTDLLLEDATPPPPPPTNLPDINLTPGVLDDGSYGNNFNGQTDVDGIFKAKFQSTQSDLLLTFEGYDIDTADEVRVFLNGKSKGFLAAGQNKGFASYSVEISAAEMAAGENVIRFAQEKDPSWTWGVTDLLLTEVVPPPSDAPDIDLTVGVLEDGSYGNKFDGQTDADGIINAKFENVESDLRLTFKGFDVDLPDEVEVLLNGGSMGFLAAGQNEGFANYSFDIREADLDAGENLITFKQSIDPTWGWGVTDLLLTQTILPPSSGGIDLTVGTLDTGIYGNKFNGQTDADGMIDATFLGTGTDLHLSFKGYDIDTDYEVEILLNGDSLGLLPAGQNEALAAYSFDISAEHLNTAENVLTIKHAVDPTWGWGVTDLLLVEADPGSPDRDINLELGVLDTGSYGNSFEGQTDQDGMIDATFQNSDSDLRLDFRGFDVDLPDEVELFLNGASLGFLSAGGNESLVDYSYHIQAEQQVAGENVLTFAQARDASWSWGVTDLLLVDDFAFV